MTSDAPVLNKPRATVDLDALAANYRTILAELSGVPAAGVVKADGYGLGAVPVATTLWAEGCRRFFVARLDEAITVRAALPAAEINVFDGVLPGTAKDLAHHDLVPTINSLDQLEAWQRLSRSEERELPTGLHLDTGMRRLGLPPDESERLAGRPDLLTGLQLRHVISHLASADVSGSPQSGQQLALFCELRRRFPFGQASLANSAGVFLGPAYHFDFARPGISVYGGSPFPDSGRPNPMRQVVTVEAPIIQVRRAVPGETVGYGATHMVASDARIATVPVGYADGFLRSASNSGLAAIAGRLVPIVGRVSMDLITIDVTTVEDRHLYPGAPVELLGRHRPVDEVAELAGTISHEFLAHLGTRFERCYVTEPA